MRPQLALSACGLALLALAALPAAAAAALRHTVHAAAVAHLPSGVSSNRSSSQACGPHRLALQQSIDRTYATQRRRLDRAVASLKEEEVESWSRTQGWKIWELYPPIYTCVNMQKVGNQPQDGGKIVCGLDTFMQHSDCNVLSFGSNGEPSFERDLLARTSCAMHVFDPTLTDASKAALAAVPEIVFHNYGLGAQDGTGDVRSLGEPGTGFPLKTLPTIMAELGINWIDLLKIDIEGGEWAVLESLLDHYGQDLPFTQLQIEFHYEPPAHTARQVLDILRRLEAAGLRTFSSEFNFLAGENVAGYIEYAFMNVKDCRVLV